MTWEEVIALLHGADWQASKRGLGRMRALMAMLGDPQKRLRFVHIAGTNGKGSAAAMLSAILTAAGYRTGRYISPHLVRMNERFCVDGREIDDDTLTALAGELRAVIAKIDDKPTNFELLTALAFLYFARERCDVVVLEVGLGGRLDATNVIDCPLVALIMRIGLEHTAELGDTIGQIALEKAGIVKAGGDVVLCAQDEEAEEAVRRVCTERGAGLTVTDRAALHVADIGAMPGEASGMSLDGEDGVTAPPVRMDDGAAIPRRTQVFSYRGRREMALALLGAHQIGNAAAVLDAVDLLIARHGFSIPEAAVRAGLRGVVWPGRLDVLSADPLLVVDGAHNPNGMAALAENLRLYFGGRRIILLMGVLADKNYEEMLDILRAAGGDVRIAHFLAVSPADERALSAEALLRAIGARFDCPAEACGSVADGLRRALALAEEEQPPAILACGSLYQVGEIMQYIG